uniref:Uncharacterized protein n=1 Tax=Timema bartmani TaxID=61472 RepID=A0A7R9F9U2_9NEOP|nr:unnamed protein product [Timema bartmani]
MLAKPLQHSLLQIRVRRTLQIFGLCIVAFLLHYIHNFFSHFENREKCRLRNAMPPRNLHLSNLILIHFLDYLLLLHERQEGPLSTHFVEIITSEELLHSPTPIKGFACMCHQQCQQNMIHSQNPYIKNVNQRNNRKKSLNESLSSESLREQLQVQVCKKQLEEDLLSDRHDSLWRTLSRSGALLSSLAHYTQCVQMTSCAMNRVQEAASNLVHNDLNVSDKLQKMFKNPPKSQDVVKEFQELTKGLYSSLESSKELIKFLEEKREDFAKASRNFSFYLSNTKITGNQLQRLKSQYNSIIDEYIKSRQIFDTEVPKMINM